MIAAIAASSRPAFAEDVELRMQITIELYLGCMDGCLREVSSSHPRASQDQRSSYCGMMCGCVSAGYLNQTSEEEMLMMRQRQPPTAAMQSRMTQVTASCRQAASNGLRLPGK